MSLHCLPSAWTDAAEQSHASWSFKQEYSRQSAAIYRMANLQLMKRLEQLNGEIAGLTAKVEAAKKDWLSATEPQQKAKLEKAYEDCHGEGEAASGGQAGSAFQAARPR